MTSVLATAYGPPWDAMQGSGVTSTGVNLQGGRQLPIIAVDPNRIPYGSIVRVSNSPFGANKLFVAGDTGGAIKGNHIDFYVAGGRQAQNGWGARNVNLQVVARGNGPGSVRSALQRVSSQSLGGLPQMTSGGSGGSPQSFKIPGGTVQWQGTGFNQQAFQKAQQASLLGNYISQTAKNNPYGSLGAPSSGLSALFAAGKATTGTPDPTQFFQPKTYSYRLAQQSLQGIAGGKQLATHPNAQGYVNPIPGANIGRTDMGVDANLPAGHPILAIGDSKVLGISPNWYRGQPYVAFQLLDGPMKGHVYYIAEAINPTVRAGQIVKGGQVVGRYNPNGTGLELGWGTPTPGRTLAQATSGYSEGQVTPAGTSFRNFLSQL